MYVKCSLCNEKQKAKIPGQLTATNEKNNEWTQKCTKCGETIYGVICVS